MLYSKPFKRTSNDSKRLKETLFEVQRVGLVLKLYRLPGQSRAFPFTCFGGARNANQVWLPTGRSILPHVEQHLVRHGASDVLHRGELSRRGWCQGAPLSRLRALDTLQVPRALVPFLLGQEKREKKLRILKVKI